MVEGFLQLRRAIQASLEDCGTGASTTGVEHTLPVSDPEDGLDIDVPGGSDGGSEGSPHVMYKLRAQVYHAGALDAGHYIADTLDEKQASACGLALGQSSQDDEVWFSFNDLLVSRIPRSEVLGRQRQKGSYLLFYDMIPSDKSVEGC